jgi:DNA topoisomerase I
MSGRLRRVRANDPGLERRRSGRGFTYVDRRGAKIDDPMVLERIRSLAIPPAWQEVWICADERGHLQATGVDQAGRRQYLYHQAWRARRDAEKFARLESFAERLPRFRRRVTRDLRRPDLPRERVLAGAARLLDRAMFRIGSEEYASRYHSFGLATMRRDHVRVSDGEAMFDFVGKAGRRHIVAVDDRDLIPLLRVLKQRRGGGPELLAYRENGGWRDVRSADVNGYLQVVLGPEFSAKDFRTWHATTLAALQLAVADAPTSRTGERRAIAEVVRQVAEELGNTPAVCRRSYIDPRVFDRYREGVTVDPPRIRSDERWRAEAERRVLALLRG